IKACGAQAGRLLEGLMEEIEIGIGPCRAKARRPLEIEAMRLDGAPHGVRMEIELGGDGSDLPRFGEEKAPDFSDPRNCDHLLRLLSGKGLRKRPRRPQKRQMTRRRSEWKSLACGRRGGEIVEDGLGAGADAAASRVTQEEAGAGGRSVTLSLLAALDLA